MSIIKKLGKFNSDIFDFADDYMNSSWTIALFVIELILGLALLAGCLILIGFIGTLLLDTSELAFWSTFSFLAFTIISLPFIIVLTAKYKHEHPRKPREIYKAY